MKLVSLLIVLTFTQWGAAFLCDKTFNLQTAKQMILTGTDHNTPVLDESKLLNSDLSNMALLSDSINYQILSNWEGACSETQKNVYYKMRLKHDVLKTVLDPGVKVVLNDGSVMRLADTHYEFWFRLTHTPSGNLTSDEIIGRDSGSKYFTRWQGTTTLKTITTNPTSGLTSESGSYLSYIITSPDSASLMGLLKGAWDSRVFNANVKGQIKYQLIKAEFDTLPTPAVSIHNHANSFKSLHANNFSAAQSGEFINIRLAENQKSLAPLVLLDIFGHKVSMLYPIGYTYAWNGKNSAQMNASSGIYFLQQENKLIGKFFYSRKN